MDQTVTMLALVNELEEARRAAEKEFGISVRFEDAIEHATTERGRTWIGSAGRGFRCGFSIYDGPHTEPDPRIYVAFDGEYHAYLHAVESIKIAGGVAPAFRAALRSLKSAMLTAASRARSEAAELDREVKKLAEVWK